MATTKQQPQDFDAWQQNPYTKVLGKSIKEDYVPKSDLRTVAKAAIEACARIAETPIAGEQDDITMEAKDRLAVAIRALDPADFIEIGDSVHFDSGKPESAVASHEGGSVPDEPSEDESLIACLGDDAAKLMQANPDDEMATTMLAAAIRYQQLPQSFLDFDTFLNEPPEYEELRKVRDYRHDAYRKWERVCKDALQMLAALQSGISSLDRRPNEQNELSGNAGQLPVSSAQPVAEEPVAFIRENRKIEWNPLSTFSYAAGTAVACKIPLYIHLAAPAQAVMARDFTDAPVLSDAEMSKGARKDIIQFYDRLQEIFARRFPMCRDCADDGPECPNSGLPCKWPDIRALLSRTAPPAPQSARDAAIVHSDDLAVDRFAVAMKAKLSKKRDEGYGGWEECDISDLHTMMCEHVHKRDPVDIANFAMMIHQHPQADAS